MLSEYIAELNADVSLYQSLIPITSNPTIMNSLSEEERRMAIMLQKEFERDGIHLNDADRLEVQKLSGFVVQLESIFSQNVSKQKLFQVKGDLVQDIYKTIPRHILQNTIPQSNDHEVTLSTDPHVANSILRYSPSSNLRKEVYIETNTACPENLEVLDALIRQRQDLTTKMGYPSYAHYFLSDKMAEKPENVFIFLDNVIEAAKERYLQDINLLSKVKSQVEETSDPLQPWDLTFYTGMIKEHLFQVNGENDDGSSMSGYFTIEQSIEGMKYLVQRLFGIEIIQVPLKEDERWDLAENEARSSLHSIRKFEFYDEHAKPLGIMYFDLHPRPGKYSHAAHFTVRCGKSHFSSSEPQLPIVALVCNLAPAYSNSKISILSHSEVETLFHEFGHGLHSLLSRTSFQHLSGTRAAMDFVETPSHLLEHFVWNKEFLNVIGKHYASGAHIPEENLDNLIRGRYAFKAMEVMNQCVYAKFDQIIHGPPKNWRDHQDRTTTDVFASLHKENNLFYAPETHWHSKWGHLVTYGAGYYSYLYADIFAADIWHSNFGGGSKAFDRHSGKRYWDEILVHGGAKDPNMMLKSILGREPSAESFFASIG
jgi:intermediate peptidase